MVFVAAKSALLLVVAGAMWAALALGGPLRAATGVTFPSAGSFAGHAFPVRPIEYDRTHAAGASIRRVRCPGLSSRVACYVATTR